MPTTVIIDRIEGDLAILEVDGHSIHWPVSALPSGAKEGSALQLILGTAPSADATQRVHGRALNRDTFDI